MSKASQPREPASVAGASPEPSAPAARALRTVAWVAVGILGVALLCAIVRLAWIGDDAYITLRSIENLLNGHGPVWNVGERVQTYTHPSWFGLLAVARLLTGEHYFTTITVSVLLTAYGVVGLGMLARYPAAVAAVLVTLLASRAFGDYATSGLETPLVIALLVLLVYIDARTANGETRLLPMALVLGLLATTRLDLVVLAGPAVIAHVRFDRPRRVLRDLAIGLSPLLFWIAFATFYYGSPFPITAYAKAFAHGVPTAALFEQGLRYVVHTFAHDPATCVTVAAGTAVGLCARSVRGRMLAVGTLLYCAYVVRVGGDFMAGRFFLPPFVVATALLARGLQRGPPSAAAAILVIQVVLAWMPGRPPFLHPPAADVPTPEVYGIMDERRCYYRTQGLFGPKRDIPEAGRYSDALRRQGRTNEVVMSFLVAGKTPFTAGDLFHFVDPTLCDPLLMRLPIPDPGKWRIGHFTRAAPEGYFETIATGENRLRHPGLRRFYECLHTVIAAPLASEERLAALFSLWFGGEDDGLRAYVEGRYRSPPRRTLGATELSWPVAEGTLWFDDPGVQLVGRGGLRIRYDVPRVAGALDVLVVAPMQYTFTFRSNDEEVGRTSLEALDHPGSPPGGREGDVLGYLRQLLGVRSYRVRLPADLPPFDTVDVDCKHVPWVQPAVGGITSHP